MASITGLNDDIISSAALKAFVDSLHPLSAFSVNYNAEAARKGEVVSIPLISSITATTFANTYEGADGDVTLTAREVTIDKHFLSTVDFTDTQWSKSSALTPQMLAQIGAEQGRAVAQAFISGAWAMITTANYGAIATSSTIASFGMSQVRRARLELTKAKAPTNDRALFLDPDFYDGLLSDSNNILSNLNFGPEGIREANIRRIAGMDVYESTLIPATSVGSGITLAGFAVHPSAIAVAVRTLAPQAPSEYLEARTIVDPVSGIGLGYRRHYNTASGTHFLNFEVIGGFTFGITAGLKILGRSA
jgi:hypothetical protein